MNRLASGDREDERVAGRAAVAELVAETSGAELLDRAVAHASIALVLVDVVVPTSLVGERAASGVAIGAHFTNFVVRRQLGAITRIVGHVAVRRKERLRERFRGVGANGVAERQAACRKRGALGSVSERRRPVGGVSFASVRRADHDLRGAQLVGKRLEVGIDQGGITDIVRTAAVIDGEFKRESVAIVRRKNTECQPDVLQVVHAFNTLGFGFCFGERWQEHTGQDRDDRNDDQQLDEREGANFVFAKYAFHDCSFGYWVTVRAL
jgi:hypothetical protein